MVMFALSAPNGTEPAFFDNIDDARTHSRSCVRAGLETEIHYFPDPAEDAVSAAVCFRLGDGHLV